MLKQISIIFFLFLITSSSSKAQSTNTDFATLANALIKKESEHLPVLKTALLVEEDDKKIFALQLKALGFIPTIYSPAYQLVTPLLVKQCHDTGIKIIPWTVEDKATMQQLLNLGVDGLISDYPDLYNYLRK